VLSNTIAIIVSIWHATLLGPHARRWKICRLCSSISRELELATDSMFYTLKSGIPTLIYLDTVVVAVSTEKTGKMVRALPWRDSGQHACTVDVFLKVIA